MEQGWPCDLHPTLLASRRHPWYGKDALRTFQSHPNGARKHENPGSADSHRHEPEETGSSYAAFDPPDHRDDASQTKASMNLKQIFNTHPGLFSIRFKSLRMRLSRLSCSFFRASSRSSGDTTSVSRRVVTTCSRSKAQRPDHPQLVGVSARSAPHPGHSVPLRLHEGPSSTRWLATKFVCD